MRVLLAHNSYLQPGGEDVAFQADAALLRDRGHDVRCYLVCNDQIPSMGRGSLVRKTLWNRQASSEIRELIRSQRPDVLHLHNTFPLLSPSVAAAGRALGVPVVQTLHNYRLICPSAQLFRDRRLCSECVGRIVPWPSVVHRCYRGSRAASAMVALSAIEQRLTRRLGKSADIFVVLTESARVQFIDAGLQPERIIVRPNFLPADPGRGTGAGGYALFAGRLSPEKGVKTLLDAWSLLTEPIDLKIVGDGPQQSVVMTAATDSRIDYLGWRSRNEVIDLLKGAAVLIVPSLWSEGMPQIIVESLAVGTPVIASRLGAMAEMLRHGESGVLVTPGDASMLAEAVSHAVANADVLTSMRTEARRSFEQHYMAGRAYDLLMEIYERAQQRARSLSHIQDNAPDTAAV